MYVVVASLNGDTPLFVVDGFARPLEYINLSEIESISVLKDGAATALWGRQRRQRRGIDNYQTRYIQ